MKTLKRGFTLVELMIVVAIIGLLAALAIPNFIKMQARSRQSEGRSNLKAVYTGEKSYYGDKQAYSDLLDVIGFEPEMNNRYSYYAGTGTGNELRSTACAAPTKTAGASIDCPKVSGISEITVDQCKWGAPVTASKATDFTTITGMVDINKTGVAATGIGVTAVTANSCCPNGACEFAAGAEGNIDNDPTLDAWFISSDSTVTGGVGVACTGTSGITASGNTGTCAEGEPCNTCNDVVY